MKNFLLALPIVAACLLLKGDARANPYFRVLKLDDISSYQPIGGAFVDPTAHGSSPDKGGMLPLIYHSHADGYLWIKGEDWAPLAVGGITGASGNKVAIGPIWNVLQMAEYLGAQGLSYVTPASWATNVKNSLQQPLTSSFDLSASIGPTFVWDPNENKGYFRIFMGGALHF